MERRWSLRFSPFHTKSDSDNNEKSHVLLEYGRGNGQPLIVPPGAQVRQAWEV